MGDLKTCGDCEHFEEDDNECGPMREFLEAQPEGMLPSLFSYQVWDNSLACDRWEPNTAQRRRDAVELRAMAQDYAYDEWRDGMVGMTFRRCADD